MAIKQSINFGIQLYGDGVATSITVTLATAAMSFNSPTGQALLAGFTVGALVPTGVVNTYSSDGTTTTATLGLLGLTVTFNFVNALAAGTTPIIYGTLVF
jgi:hypothetical protein